KSMSINERKRQKKLVKKNARRKKVVLAAKREIEEMEKYVSVMEYPFKMSDVIMDFAQPLLEGAETDDEMRGALSFAIIAWNASFLSEEKRKDIIGQLVKESNSSEEAAEMLELVNELIAHKQMYYAEINRMIVSYEITGFGASLRLSVASTEV
ncbi:MAG: hypothetical protein AB1489_43180, partial [Acidobacteriota bacterium]